MDFTRFLGRPGQLILSQSELNNRRIHSRQKFHVVGYCRRVIDRKVARQPIPGHPAAHSFDNRRQYVTQVMLTLAPFQHITPNPVTVGYECRPAYRTVSFQIIDGRKIAAMSQVRFEQLFEV